MRVLKFLLAAIFILEEEMLLNQFHSFFRGISVMHSDCGLGVYRSNIHHEKVIFNHGCSDERSSCSCEDPNGDD
jgi:hypothetical protein